MLSKRTVSTKKNKLNAPTPPLNSNLFLGIDKYPRKKTGMKPHKFINSDEKLFPDAVVVYGSNNGHHYFSELL